MHFPLLIEPTLKTHTIGVSDRGALPPIPIKWGLTPTERIQIELQTNLLMFAKQLCRDEGIDLDAAYLIASDPTFDHVMGDEIRRKYNDKLKSLRTNPETWDTLTEAMKLTKRIIGAESVDMLCAYHAVIGAQSEALKRGEESKYIELRIKYGESISDIFNRSSREGECRRLATATAMIRYRLVEACEVLIDRIDAGEELPSDRSTLTKTRLTFANWTILNTQTLSDYWIDELCQFADNERNRWANAEPMSEAMLGKSLQSQTPHPENPTGMQSTGSVNDDIQESKALVMVASGSSPNGTSSKRSTRRGKQNENTTTT